VVAFGGAFALFSANAIVEAVVNSAAAISIVFFMV
jgi:hypothetical protein